MKNIVAQNLAAIMAARQEDLGTQAKVALASKGAINQTTVGRILREEHAITLETLVALSLAVGMEPYQLLIWNLDPKNPQVLRALSKEEENLYRALEEARRSPGTQ